jgi:hypothetical protein
LATDLGRWQRFKHLRQVKAWREYLKDKKNGEDQKRAGANPTYDSGLPDGLF